MGGVVRGATLPETLTVVPLRPARKTPTFSQVPFDYSKGGI